MQSLCLHHTILCIGKEARHSILSNIFQLTIGSFHAKVRTPLRECALHGKQLNQMTISVSASKR